MWCRSQQELKNGPREEPGSRSLLGSWVHHFSHAVLLPVVTCAAARGHCCLSLSPVAAAAFHSVYRPGCPSLWGKMLKLEQENMK